ncbi:MAG TPA: response regulator [Pyrinomonadaceae bacterium]
MSRVVFAIVEDMFFASKIRATAEALGVEVFFLRSQGALTEKAKDKKPDLILVDLHNQKLDAIELATELKGKDEVREAKLLAFFSHVETELQRKALDAGFDQVVPRSVFSRDLSEILKGNYPQITPITQN